MDTFFRWRTTPRAKKPRANIAYCRVLMKTLAVPRHNNNECVQVAPICLHKILISDVFIIIILLFYWWFFCVCPFVCVTSINASWNRTISIPQAFLCVRVCLHVAAPYPILIPFSHSAAAAIDSIIWYPVVWWIGDTINIWLRLSALILAITGDGV